MTYLKSSYLPVLSMAAALLLSACGGGGGGTTTTPVTPPAPVAQSVTLSGTLTYDRVPFVPFRTTTSSNNGLNFNGTTQLPIRSAPVELINAAGTVLETTVSDDNGAYSFEVLSGEEVRVRVRSEIQKNAPNEVDLQVVDNTSGDVLYAIQGALGEVPTTNQIRNLNADSGWNGTRYAAARAAAPFALLDTLYATLEDFIAVDPDIDFPAFDVQWSTRNTTQGGNVDVGQIGTSSFTIENRGTNAAPDIVPVIRILGDENNDTDEFDVHVVVHEFGHYFENQLSRSDSIGGTHSSRDLLDPRVAFGEGWGNALSGMILEDPIYRDSFGTSQTSGFGIDVENNANVSSGWYSEGSVQSILYDLFDDDDDGADRASYGLAPIYGAFTDPDYANTEAFTTIFAFLEALGNQPGLVESEITALTNAQDISGTTGFGIGETNTGGLVGAVPVYLTLPTNGSRVNFCSFDNFSIFNKHGNRRYLEFDIPTAGAYRFVMTRDRSPAADSGVAGSDPDFLIFNQGAFVAAGESAVNNSETQTINLAAGQHVMEAYSFDNVFSLDGGQTSGPDVNPGDTCYTMTLEAQ